MKIVCTICSRSKNENKGLLPADERYIGDHIGKAKEISKQSNVPLFILSGKYGLISSKQKIPYYDYYLEDKNIDSLAKTVYQQIKKANITEIDFYREEKEGWKPYIIVMQKGANLAEITLHIHDI